MPGPTRSTITCSPQTRVISLKSLISAGETLLQPPSPLPSSPPLLISRLEASAALLPTSWLASHGWGPIHAEKHNVNTPDGGHDLIHDDGDVEEQTRAIMKNERDRLVLQVGKRCLDILESMQDWLEKEFWPVEFKSEMSHDNDSRHFASFLLPITIEYHSSLLSSPSPSPHSTTLSTALSRLLNLALTLPPPSSRPTSSTPSSSSSSQIPTNLPNPPTLITQTLISSHLPPILLSSFILAWTPTSPPSTHAPLRSLVNRVLSSISPTQGIAVLGATLKLAHRSRGAGKNQGKGKAKGWARGWPGYVEGVVASQISMMVRRPGGVRGVMENIFGEAANIGSNEDGDKLEHVASVLSKIPKTMSPQAYIPHLLTALFQLITVVASVPPIYTHSACYTVHRFWQGPHRELVQEWLSNKLHHPFTSSLSDFQERSSALDSEGIIVASATEVREIVGLISMLVLHSPPGPDFIHFIVSPLFTPLLALKASISRTQAYEQVHIEVSGKGKGKGNGEGNEIEKMVDELLRGWGKLVDKDQGVKTVWSVIEGSKFWKGDDVGRRLVWIKDKSGEWSLIFGYFPDDQDNAELPSAIIKPSMMRASDNDESLGVDQMMDQLQLYPDPTTLVQWLKDIDRSEMTSDLFLRVIEEWRVRASDTDDQDPLKTLLFLRLTMEMIEKIGEKILQRPNQVLEFVEGVLNDESKFLKNGSESNSKSFSSQVLSGGAKKPMIQVVGEEEKENSVEDESESNGEGELPDLTAEGVKNMGLVESAISLLLASLEANESLNHSTSSILYPINDHLEVLSDRSPQRSVRHLAREALLILLIRRTASLTTTPSSTTSTAAPISSSVQTYRQALQFIADPILPVRAHGLALLRDLPKSPAYDSGLTLGIMDVFIASVLDKDSFVYLNAVQGLAGMVDSLGKEVCKVLVRRWSECLVGMQAVGMGVRNTSGGEGIGEEKMEKALRLGEALGLVIRRAGSAFSVYADLVVPSLIEVFPQQTLPTIIRSSALSLLSSCAEADHLALLPWSAELVSAALDLVQVESVVAPRSANLGNETEEMGKEENEMDGFGKMWLKRPKIVLVDDEEEEEEDDVNKDGVSGNVGSSRSVPIKPKIIDTDPTKIGDNKHPALRRAAIVFLGLLFASLIESLSVDSDSTRNQNPQKEEFLMRLPGQVGSLNSTLNDYGDEKTRKEDKQYLEMTLIGRAKSLMRYVSQTDVDQVVRGQAAEVGALAGRLDVLQQLGKVRMML